MSNEPLLGKKILITRAREQSREFTTRLKRLGAEVIEFPTIEIVPPSSWKGVDHAVAKLKSYDWVIFTSANGVNFFFQRLKEKGKNRRSLSGSKICAIGPATAKQLKKRKVRVDFVPKEFIAESILRGFKKMGTEGNQILLARAKKARDVLPIGLKGLGAIVDVVEVYRTIKPKGGSRRLKHLLEKGKVDVVTFTSSSTVSHFIDLLKKEDLKNLLKGVAIACIGPVTARTVKEAGLKVHIQPEEFTIPALTQAIAKYFGRD
ncbi:MAG: uroporphyrinogen-III synthase [Deltaproteobacteria bacterium]|nr:uroporphyrinogen-III synthase [Deltaproteobacteria bacterium]